VVVSFAWLEHLAGYDLEAYPFEAGNNFADDTTLQGVRLENNECSFHSVNNLFLCYLMLVDLAVVFTILTD